MRYSYRIKALSMEKRSGWKLMFLENAREVGSDVFPVHEEDPQAGIAWWNSLSDERRAHWLMMAASAMPAAARHAYLLAEAYNNAQDAADAWMSTRK
jgi:hypothetical protein